MMRCIIRRRAWSKFVGIPQGQTTIFVIELNEWCDAYSLGKARDIARAIVHLELAGFVTGEILHVDGGQSAGH